MISSKILREYINRGMIRDYIDLDTQLQPAGFDITVGKVFSFEGVGTLDFSNKKRTLPHIYELKFNDYIILKPGVYIATPNEYVSIPKELAAILLPRSSSLSCGMEVHTALWDPGYKGRGRIYVSVNKEIKIYKNARIAQLVFFTVKEPEREYDGDYNGEDLLK